MDGAVETAVVPAGADALAISRSGLTDGALALLAQSLAPETLRAYRTDLTTWKEWCTQHDCTPIPASPTAVTNFITDLATGGASVSRLSRVLAALRKAHAVAGLALDTSQAREAVSGYRRKRAVAKAKPRKMDPLSPKELRAMVEVLDLSTLRGLRDRALLLIGFSTACRRVELADLDLGDLVSCEEGLVVKVYRRKLRKVTEVAVVYGQHALTCPIRSWNTYTEALAAYGYAEADAPAFPRIGRDGIIGGRSAGRGSDDGRMTGGGIATVICRAAERAGVQGDIGGHSLRRGFATSARAAGADHLAIARQGGWADGSRAVFGYMDEVDRFGDLNPLRGIGL